MSQLPCRRCGSFLDARMESLGAAICSECVQRVVEGEPRRTSATSVGVGIGALVGVGVGVVFVLLDPKALILIYYAVGAGIVLGGMIGFPIDARRARRARAERGYGDYATIAALDVRSPAAMRSGFVFVGDRRLIFAARGLSEPVVIEPVHVRAARFEATRAELELELPLGPAKLALAGPNSRLIAQGMQP